MEILPTIVCSTVPSLGQIIGSGNSEWIKDINQFLSTTGGGTLFAKGLRSDFLPMYDNFITKLIEPEIAAQKELDCIIRDLRLSDFKFIENIEDLEGGIPLSMQIPILSDPEILDYYVRGEINGFNIKMEQLPVDDCYGHMWNTGSFKLDRLDDDDMKDQEMFTVRWEFRLDDPQHSREELRMVMKTREFFKEILTTSRYDPTMYPHYRNTLK